MFLCIFCMCWMVTYSMLMHVTHFSNLLRLLLVIISHSMYLHFLSSSAVQSLREFNFIHSFWPDVFSIQLQLIHINWDKLIMLGIDPGQAASMINRMQSHSKACYIMEVCNEIISLGIINMNNSRLIKKAAYGKFIWHTIKKRSFQSKFFVYTKLQLFFFDFMSRYWDPQ